MARIIQTATFDQSEFCGQDIGSVYNGLDCCVTLEVEQELCELVKQNPAACKVYNAERNFQAPALEMMLRGFAVDERVRQDAIEEYRQRAKLLQGKLDHLTIPLIGRSLNSNSPKQLQDFFYGTMALPRVHSGKNFRVSTDRKALEKLSAYMYARPFINIILALRDCTKVLGVLVGGVDEDGRIRASYNVAGTETGRWSSSENAFGTGTNLQNITEKLRKMFIADAGMRMGYFDLEQAESRAVGLIIFRLFGDTKYLDACEAGDLHTTVCQMIWRDLKWSKDPEENRAIADVKFYRDFSYRDLAKRGGHGTNYYGQPRTMAKHLAVEPKLVETFQQGYFSAFPGIRKWHQWVAEQLQLSGTMTTFMGRQRHFFGRLWDDSTLREAIAFEPQSVVGDIMNEGIHRAWTDLGHRVQTHGQVHDAGIFQYPEGEEDELVPILSKLLVTPMVFSGRKFEIPIEAKVGWNWGVESKDNPNGLRKYKGHDNRTYSKAPSILHRVLR